MSLVDSFHAMVSKRPYQSRVKGLGYAREEIRRNAGTQFDPRLAETFVRMIEEQPDRIAAFVESDVQVHAAEAVEYGGFSLEPDAIAPAWSEVEQPRV